MNHKRTITRQWPVRFNDGEEYEAKPGDEITVIAIDGNTLEAFIQFESMPHRRGWWSWESVLWYSDRKFD